MPENGTRRRAGLAARLWNKLWNSPQPTLGCEISQEGISLGRWSAESLQLQTAVWKPLPAGAVQASPLRENIQRPEEVRQALAGALASLGLSSESRSAGNSSSRPTDVVLVIPDPAARLFVLDLDTFPSKPQEALPLLKWRLKKSVPFDIESAAISYFAHRLGSELQVVAVATPSQIVRQYEAVVESFGLRPVWVTLSTLAALGLLPASAPEENRPAQSEARQAASESEEPEGKSRGLPGVLVAKYSPAWFTTAILQAGHLRLFRPVGLEAGGNGPLSASDVLEIIYPSVIYFQDNFEGPLKRAYLCGLGENSAALAASLESELHLEALPLVAEPGDLPAGLESAPWERHFAALSGVAREQLSG